MSMGRPTMVKTRPAGVRKGHALLGLEVGCEDGMAPSTRLFVIALPIPLAAPVANALPPGPIHSPYPSHPVSQSL